MRQIRSYQFKALTGLLALSAAGFVSAEEASTWFSPEKFSASASLGALSGETKERVYSTGGKEKISQLDWKYSNAAIVKGRLEWEPIEWVTLGASGWTTLAGKGGEMNDYDWLNKDNNALSHYSHHPDTRLNFANEYDLNVTGWIVNEPDWRVGVMAGYQESRYSFTAKGGTFRYDNGATTGSFNDGVAVIGYKQRYRTPYIGLTGRYRYENYEIDGAFKYSGWVHSSDNDEHYLKTTTYTADVHNQNFYALSGSVGYYITPNTKLFMEGVWSRTTNKKGDTQLNNYDRNIHLSAAKRSGIENNNVMLTTGVKYIF